MTQSLRITIADDELVMRKFFQEFLPRLGHELVSTAATGTELVQQVRDHRPDLVITDIKMPDMDGIEAAIQVNQKATIPVILVSAFHDAELIERAEAANISAYLVKPIGVDNLKPAIALAMRRHQEFERVKQESRDLKQALRDRKLIERAKGILMRLSGTDEEEAFGRMRKLARDKNLKIVDVAEIILAANESMRPRTKSGTSPQKGPTDVSST